MKQKDQKKPEPRMLKAWLVGDIRMAIGDIALFDSSEIQDFANAAYRKASGSLKRLMQPKWAVVIVEENGTEHSFGLEKWNKLYSPEEMKQREVEAQRRERDPIAKRSGRVAA